MNARSSLPTRGTKVCATCRQSFVVGNLVIKIVGSGRYNTGHRFHGPINSACIPQDLDNTCALVRFHLDDLVQQ